MRILMYYLIAVNVAAWIMYGLDKWKARSGKWRISERNLLIVALIGGSVGALAVPLSSDLEQDGMTGRSRALS